jgi:hypothetical protein
VKRERRLVRCGGAAFRAGRGDVCYRLVGVDSLASEVVVSDEVELASRELVELVVRVV